MPRAQNKMQPQPHRAIAKPWLLALQHASSHLPQVICPVRQARVLPDTDTYVTKSASREGAQYFQSRTEVGTTLPGAGDIETLRNPSSRSQRKIARTHHVGCSDGDSDIGSDEDEAPRSTTAILQRVERDLGPPPPHIASQQQQRRHTYDGVADDGSADPPFVERPQQYRAPDRFGICCSSSKSVMRDGVARARTAAAATAPTAAAPARRSQDGSETCGSMSRPAGAMAPADELSMPWQLRAIARLQKQQDALAEKRLRIAALEGAMMRRRHGEL